MPGMPEERTIKVRWIKAGGKAPADLDAAADATVEYKGAEVTRRMNGCQVTDPHPPAPRGKTFVTRGVLY